MSYRAIITGHTPSGRSTLLHDRTVPESAGWMHHFWSSSPGAPDNSAATDDHRPGGRLAPEPGGSIFRIFRILPDSEVAKLTAADLEVITGELGGPAAGARPGEKLWHRTETVDYVVMLEGEATLHLDDADIDLKPFDVVVQRGSHHAWSNRGDKPAVAACILLGAAPLGIAPPPLTRAQLALG